MNAFQHKNNELYVEDLKLTDIANEFGTPCYVYSRAELENNWRAFDHAFADYPHRICYAVKANPNLAILNLLAKLNSGFDIVSIGELERVLAAGGNPKQIVFSGVGKCAAEINRALEVGIYCFNVESESELTKLNFLAKQQNKIASIALRINPNIDARTHPYIATGLHENKFGIEITHAFALCQQIKTLSHIKLIGIGCHIGSQLTEIEPFLEALDCILRLADELAKENIQLQNINIGGGLGIRYRDEQPPAIQAYVAALHKKLNHRQIEIILEPGRVIVANAGILLTKVEYLKHSPHKNFAIVDAGMNDYIRPALYAAWQHILPVVPRDVSLEKSYDIVGPVCESADFLGKDRQLALQEGDLLAILSAGAYGSSMSSTYNSRPRIAEIMVDGNKAHLIRQRESIQDLFAAEKIIRN